MVIEHSFVTTLESNQALGAASEFLSGLGFVAAENPAFQIDQQAWTELEMKRARRKGGGPGRCEQQVRLDFDRGRVNVAASVLAQVTRSFTWSSYGFRDLKPNSKLGRQYSAMMVALVESLEDLLARNAPPQQASQRYLQQEQQSDREFHRYRRNRIIALVIFILVIVGLLVIPIVVTSRR